MVLKKLAKIGGYVPLMLSRNFKNKFFKVPWCYHLGAQGIFSTLHCSSTLLLFLKIHSIIVTMKTRKKLFLIKFLLIACINN